MLAVELFAKALRSLETCVLVNNNLWWKLFSSLEPTATFDESYFKVYFSKLLQYDFLFLILIYLVAIKLFYWVVL